MRPGVPGVQGEGPVVAGDGLLVPARRPVHLAPLPLRARPPGGQLLGPVQVGEGAHRVAQSGTHPGPPHQRPRVLRPQRDRPVEVVERVLVAAESVADQASAAQRDRVGRVQGVRPVQDGQGLLQPPHPPVRLPSLAHRPGPRGRDLLRPVQIRERLLVPAERPQDHRPALVGAFAARVDGDGPPVVRERGVQLPGPEAVPGPHHEGGRPVPVGQLGPGEQEAEHGGGAGAVVRYGGEQVAAPLAQECAVGVLARLRDDPGPVPGTGRPLFAQGDPGAQGLGQRGARAGAEPVVEHFEGGPAPGLLGPEPFRVDPLARRVPAGDEGVGEAVVRRLPAARRTGPLEAEHRGPDHGVVAGVPGVAFGDERQLVQPAVQLRHGVRAVLGRRHGDGEGRSHRPGTVRRRWRSPPRPHRGWRRAWTPGPAARRRAAAPPVRRSPPPPRVRAGVGATRPR